MIGSVPSIPLNKYPVPTVTTLFAISKKELGRARAIVHSPEFRNFAEKFASPAERRYLNALYAVNIMEAVLMNFSSPLGAGLAAMGAYDQATNLFRKEMGERGLTVTGRPALGTFDSERNRSDLFMGAIRTLGRGRKGPPPSDYDIY